MKDNTVTVETKEGYITFLTLAQAARELGVVRMTLFRWYKKGQLFTIPFGGRRWVPFSEVERLQRERKDDNK